MLLVRAFMAQLNSEIPALMSIGLKLSSQLVCDYILYLFKLKSLFKHNLNKT